MNDRYKALRRDLIELLAEHPDPDSALELSFVANRMDELAREMDSIAADRLSDALEFSTIQRDTEL